MKTRGACARDALRRETGAAHRSLDGLWSGRDLADPSIYVAFLRGIAGALLPIEAALTRSGADAVLPDWALRRRGAAIEADLHGLDASAVAGPAASVSGVAMFGALYVLEGSRLGGTLLARQVGASTHPAVLANRRFLQHGQGAAFWRGFLDRLERADPTTGEVDLICEQANACFALFELEARKAIDDCATP